MSLNNRGVWQEAEAKRQAEEAKKRAEAEAALKEEEARRAEKKSEESWSKLTMGMATAPPSH